MPLVNPPVDLKELLSTARVASKKESEAFFKPDDFRWSETLTGDDSPEGKPVIYINDKKFQDSGASNYRDKAALSESIHLLKDVNPDYYNRLLHTALSDPNTEGWLRDSYARETAGEKAPLESIRDTTGGEKRPFDEWLRKSRLDQVIGGYMFAGDEAFPTMKDWNRDELPFGSLRPELERIRQFNFGDE